MLLFKMDFVGVKVFDGSLQCAVGGWLLFVRFNDCTTTNVIVVHEMKRNKNILQ